MGHVEAVETVVDGAFVGAGKSTSVCKHHSVSIANFDVAAAQSVILTSMGAGSVDAAADLVLTAGGSLEAATHDSSLAYVGGAVAILSTQAEAHAGSTVAVEALGRLDLSAQGVTSLHTESVDFAALEGVELAAGGDLTLS